MSVKEKEIFSCHTGLGLSDDFFRKQPYMAQEDLWAVVRNLVQECDGIIKEPGMYGFYLRIVKLK